MIDTNVIFYETAETGNAFLVTGNIKHFPDVEFAVSPAEMMRIIEQ